MRTLLAFGLTLILLASCGRADQDLATYRLLAMATWVDITLPRDVAEREPELIRAIEDELRVFERDYYAWGEGELAALNRALSESRDFEASDGMTAVLRDAQNIARTTGGAFDPGVGALVELWGFNSDEASRQDTDEPGGQSEVGPGPQTEAGRETASQPPSETEIAGLLAATGSIQDLVIDGWKIRSQAVRDATETVEANDDGVAPDRRPGAEFTTRFTLDLGGIAKGAAVDRVIARLRAHGVTPALVNAGGDLGVVGEPADRSWRIGIQAPRSDGMLGAIALHDGEAAFTSGDYERFYDVDGQRMHHILDPRTGIPVDHTQAITVVTRSGTLADAAATALFVAGPGEWRSMAEALGIEAVLRVDATGAIEMTAAMRDRFQPNR
jgi:thiamine biosynthesis lipoprotein